MSQIDDRGSGDVALSWAEQERTLPWTKDTRRYVERLERSDGERIDTRRDTDTKRERDRDRDHARCERVARARVTNMSPRTVGEIYSA
jgi:hypothetical protein